jgi:hypothetical protein
LFKGLHPSRVPQGHDLRTNQAKEIFGITGAFDLFAIIMAQTFNAFFSRRMTLKSRDDPLTVGIDLAFQTSFFRRMTATPRGAVAILEAFHAMARGGIALLVRAGLEVKLTI